MATYTPISFAPIIYPAWGKLFEKLPDSQKAEILMAITNYPDYEPKEDNFAWPFIKGEIEKQFERFLDRTQKARDARNASRPKQTTDDRGRPQSTVVDERRPTSTMVDHKPEPIPEPEPELESEIDIHTHSAEPSASVSESSKPKPKKKKVAEVQKPEDLKQEVWDEYLKIRKDKNMPLTQRALDRLKAEGEKADLTLKEVIERCVEEEWGGFKAKWIEAETARKREERDYWKIKPVHDWQAEQEAYIKAKREQEEKEGLHHAEAIQRYLNGERA